MTLAIKTGTGPAGDISEGLPEGWALTTLRDACQINPPKASKDSLPADAPVTFVPMQAVDAEDGAITKPQTRKFSEVRKGFTSFRENDVIMAKITPCMENGKAAVAKNLINGLGFGSTEFHVFRSTGAALPEFVYHFLRQESYRRAAEAEMTGSVGQKRVPQTFLETTELPLPPLLEQTRIVRSLTGLFKELKASDQRLKRVREIGIRFRQTVLAAACSGRLTEGWRELNKVSEDATHQLERMQVERREHFAAANGKGKYREPDAVLEEDLPQIPETWCWTNFDHCSWEITVGHVGPMRDRYVAKGIRFLRCQNVRPLHFDPHGLVHIPPDFHTQLSKSKLSGGEILVVRSGANTGDCCVFPHNLAPANCSDLVITRPLSGLCAEYGALYVSSPNGQARLTFNETGIAQPHFNIGAMRVKAFPLPPLAEQREIIGRVEALFSLADTIEERVVFSSLRTERLAQSVLAKAFRGELVPTEAELARREGRDYELASALLERIRAERANHAQPSPSPKRRVRKSNAHV